MGRKRKALPLSEQFAAALACLLPQEQRDQLRHSKASAKAVIRLFTMHHLDYHALGGADAWFNLHPMLRQDHAERFGQDASAIAKVKRLQRQFRPEMVGGMVALIEVDGQHRCKWCGGDGIGCCSGAINRTLRQARGKANGESFAPAKPKRRIVQRARPWPPKGSRPMKWKDAPWPK